ncbi:MAG: tRNA modification GTPase [Planctomycetota bacterium]|nr:MAG: tRNA modification GTPase [Planctomycetota bacterium]
MEHASVRLTVDDTIAALASPPGAAVRGVIRVSGPQTRAIVRRLFQPDEPEQWNAARAARRLTGTVRCRLAEDVRVPAAVYLWPTSRSFTGQPAAELHLCGAPVLFESVLEALYANGARPAQPGEFTLRAFLAGRIDLVQAEAVLGVIDADEPRQLQAALKQLAGGLSGELAAVRNDLLELLADIEAGLDFVEEDIEFVSTEEIRTRLEDACARLDELLRRAQARLEYGGRFRVVLAGLPNAGKSTLFNALAGCDAALVSEREGTTTDYLTARLEWNGVLLELVDTAGWEDLLPSSESLSEWELDTMADGSAATGRPDGRERSEGSSATVPEFATGRASVSADGIAAGGHCSDRQQTAMVPSAADTVAVKSMAQQRRLQQMGEADLIVWCTPCDADAAFRRRDEAALEYVRRAGRPLVHVGTKSDLRRDVRLQHRIAERSAVGQTCRSAAKDHRAAAIIPESRNGDMGTTAESCRMGKRPDVFVACAGGRTWGLDTLKDRILDRLFRRDGGRGEIVGTTAARSRESLRAAREALLRAHALVDAATSNASATAVEQLCAGPELLAIEIRAALDALGRILGLVYTDDILDRIFSKFCIGK